MVDALKYDDNPELPRDERAPEQRLREYGFTEFSYGSRDAGFDHNEIQAALDVGQLESYPWKVRLALIVRERGDREAYLFGFGGMGTKLQPADVAQQEVWAALAELYEEQFGPT